jgi:hypothetical protein
MKTKKPLILLVNALLIGALCLAAFQPALAAGFPGAIYTTDVTCGGVNINLFDSKADVYLNGGPQGGGSGLPQGTYFVQVTDPSGATVLGKTLTASVTVDNTGSFVQCYQLMAILYSASSGFTAKGFDDSPNNGDVYKVWVSPTADFASSKTDNFKVKAGVTPATLNVIKFYDANANGLNDDGQLITGWKVRIEDGIDYIRYTPVTILIDPDDYTVTEFMPLELNWMGTTPNPVYITLAAGDNETVEFGNLCFAPGGGLTLGFWSNKNGQALIGSADINVLIALNLRNANGTDFDPANKAAFRNWLLNATATNMAYMLSAQLAAMEMNVFNGFVNPNSLIYAPGTMSANALGFATVGAVMAEANNELGLHGLTLDGSPYRTYQEALKNALDNANNNKNFVSPTPCAFSFGE